MAGFPMRRALEKKIEELGGIEFVSSHIAEGMTIGRLAEFIECSRPMLSFWINQTEERKNAVLSARKLKAEKLAEDALDIADFADGASSSAVNKARLQVDTRKWMASKLDPESFGDKSMEVNISVGDLHLQALKHMGKAIEATEVIENT
jgi:lipopolysaccharide biosynthesis regulator YciM